MQFRFRPQRGFAEIGQARCVRSAFAIGASESAS